jgi:hypothetical protein
MIPVTKNMEQVDWFYAVNLKGQKDNQYTEEELAEAFKELPPKKIAILDTHLEYFNHTPVLPQCDYNTQYPIKWDSSPENGDRYTSYHQVLTTDY